MGARLSLGLILGAAVIGGVAYYILQRSSDDVTSETASVLDQRETRGQAPDLSVSPDADLSDADRLFICRAFTSAISSSEPIDGVTAALRADYIETRYVRDDDGRVWTTACKLEAGKVIWANIDNGLVGRWRTNPADEIVSYILSEDDLTIEQKFSDGSIIADTFERE